MDEMDGRRARLTGDEAEALRSSLTLWQQRYGAGERWREMAGSVREAYALARAAVLQVQAIRARVRAAKMEPVEDEPPMSAEEYQAACQYLNWEPRRIGEVLNWPDRREVRRWWAGQLPIPAEIAHWLRGVVKAIRAARQSQGEAGQAAVAAAMGAALGDVAAVRETVFMRRRERKAAREAERELSDDPIPLGTGRGSMTLEEILGEDGP